MKSALLPERGVVKVVGDGARKFLHGLVTADVLDLTPGAARFCALLAPQGKIIADFLVTEAPAAAGGGFFLDVERAQIAAFIDKLNLYKLRAKVIVEDLSEVLGVLAAWNGESPVGQIRQLVRQLAEVSDSIGLCYPDPRLPALGFRVMLPPHRAPAVTAAIGAEPADAAAYEAHRIALGIPRGGRDFAYGDAFPHEADMDQLGGVDFHKGCYIGQEVVSRMEHRGTARSRAVPIAYDGAAPEPATPVVAGDRTLGTMGSAAAGRGIALLRLDRVADALTGGETITVAGLPVRLIKPDWARFAFPGESKAAE